MHPTATVHIYSCTTKQIGLQRRLFSSCLQVVAFIKGTRTQPQCGFSFKVLTMLNEARADYEVVDVLDEQYNPGVREAIKTYSQWPTIPQVRLEALPHSACVSCTPCAHSATTYPCNASLVVEVSECLQGIRCCMLSCLPSCLVANLDSFASVTTTRCTLGSLGDACMCKVQLPWLGSLIEICLTSSSSQRHQGRLR